MTHNEAEKRVAKKEKAKQFQEEQQRKRAAGKLSGRQQQIIAIAAQRFDEKSQLPGSHGGKTRMRKSRTHGESIKTASQFLKPVLSSDTLAMKPEVDILASRDPNNRIPTIFDASVLLHWRGTDIIPDCAQTVNLVLEGKLQLLTTPKITDEVMTCVRRSRCPESSLRSLGLTKEDELAYKRLFELAVQEPHRHIEVVAVPNDPSDAIYMWALAAYQKSFPGVVLVTRDEKHLLSFQDKTLPLSERSIVRPQELLQILWSKGIALLGEESGK